MKRTRLVAASRLSEEAFWKRSLLGQSLLAIPDLLRPELALCFDNDGEGRQGLSRIYNRAIEECPDDRYLLFVHDDVFLHDPFIEQRIHEGLRENGESDDNDVIGLAGSRGGDLSEPSWALAFNENLDGIGWQSNPAVLRSGFVSHRLTDESLSGRPPKVQLSAYGEVPDRCDLLDGLFLAVRPDALKRTGTRFDEQFEFHFYDLDFCRTALRAGLRLSTWPILVTHASGGAFGTAAWKLAASRYLDKWASPHPSRSKTVLPVSHSPVSPTQVNPD